MKMETTFRTIFVSMFPIANLLVLGTGVGIGTAGIMVLAPQKANADIVSYLKSAHKKSTIGDHEGAITDFTKAIKMKTNNSGLLSIAYEGRALNRLSSRGISDKRGICFDLRQASSLGSQSATSTFYELCDN